MVTPSWEGFRNYNPPMSLLRKVFPMVHPMMPEQLALEEEMREATRARYFSLHAKAEARGDLAEPTTERHGASLPSGGLSLRLRLA